MALTMDKLLEARDVMAKGDLYNPLDAQVGGQHYKDMPIQPVEFCQKNHLQYCESNVIKYVCRHRAKGGRKDIEKAIHYLQLILQLEYENPPH